MKHGRFLACGALTLLAACSRGEGNATSNDANNAAAAAAEGEGLNMAISGDELSPIPEAEDDMIANNSGVGNAVGNQAAPQPPTGPAAPPSPAPPRDR